MEHNFYFCSPIWVVCLVHLTAGGNWARAAKRAISWAYFNKGRGRSRDYHLRDACWDHWLCDGSHNRLVEQFVVVTLVYRHNCLVIRSE